MAFNRPIKEPVLRRAAQKALVRATRLAKKFMEENPQRKIVVQKLIEAGYNEVVAKAVYRRARSEMRD